MESYGASKQSKECWVGGRWNVVRVARVVIMNTCTSGRVPSTRNRERATCISNNAGLTVVLSHTDKYIIIHASLSKDSIQI